MLKLFFALGLMLGLITCARADQSLPTATTDTPNIIVPSELTPPKPTSSDQTTITNATEPHPSTPSVPLLPTLHEQRQPPAPVEEGFSTPDSRSDSTSSNEPQSDEPILPLVPNPATDNEPTITNLPATSPSLAMDQAPSGDLWALLRSGFGMPDMTVDAPLVTRHIAWLSARPDYVDRTLQRSRMYLYFIIHEVQRRGMPTEIALLPLVESAFNPHAISRNQASGMWQFIPSTAQLFGLHRDWWYDGRKDIVSTTYSALDYLQRLHDEFHDWGLALAGYNCGEGKIRREIAYNRAHGLPIDLEHLSLPDETRNYVPKLLAAKTIILDPDHYGLALPALPDQPYFASVTTHQSLDIKVAAQFCQLSTEEFLMLNPGFNRPIIQLNAHRERTILVPVSAAQSFLAHLDDPEAKLVSWQPRQLHRGEPLEQVAREYGMTGDELKRVNGIANNKKLASGGLVLVPVKTSDTSSPEDIPVNSKATPEAELASSPSPSHHRSRQPSPSQPSQYPASNSRHHHHHSHHARTRQPTSSHSHHKKSSHSHADGSPHGHHGSPHPSTARPTHSTSHHHKKKK